MLAVPFLKGCSTNLCNQVINNAILSVPRMEDVLKCYLKKEIDPNKAKINMKRRKFSIF